MQTANVNSSCMLAGHHNNLLITQMNIIMMCITRNDTVCVVANLYLCILNKKMYTQKQNNHLFYMVITKQL